MQVLRKISVGLIVSFLVLSINCISILAAHFSVSVTNNGNGSCTVTVSGNVVGGLQIEVAGQSKNVGIETLGGSASASFQTGAGTYTVTVTAISLSDAHYNIYEGETVTKTVTVTEPSQSEGSNGGSNSGSGSGSVSSGGNTQQGTQNSEPSKSSDATLASLSVSEGTMSPSFKSGTSKYELSLPSDTTKIKIEAKANDSKAKVNGTGEVELKQGNNKISITVTAEDGTTKTYTINAYVEETPEVFLTYNDTQLGVVKNTDNVSKPGDAFEEVKLKIDGKEVTGWQNNIMNVTVLYMIDEESGEKGFYLYDSEQQALTSSFRPMTLLGNRLFVVDIAEDLQKREGMTFTTVTVDEQELPGWRYDESGFDNYSLIYVMNEQGEMQYYQYEASQNTLQLYSNAAPVSTETYQHDRQIEQIAIIAAGIFAVTTIAALIGCVMIRRRSNLRIRQLHKKESE